MYLIRQAMVMTEKKTEESIMENIEKSRGNARINRRKILKAGAVIAPLAVTLHSGVPLAHAASAACDVKMDWQKIIPEFEAVKNHDGTYTNTKTGKILGYRGTAGKTGRILEFGIEETHWDYISQPGVTGHSCYNSIVITGGTPNL